MDDVCGRFRTIHYKTALQQCGLRTEVATEMIVIAYIRVSNFKRCFMKWYNYISCFFAGLFLANVVPHFIHGISGDPFPTPFAHPPGKGLSSPMVNVLWALLNLVIGYLFYRGGKISNSRIFTVILLFAGIALMSMMLSMAFVEKMH